MRLIYIFILLFILSGCDVVNDFKQALEAGKKLTSLEMELDEIYKRIDFLEKENQDLKNIQETIIPTTATLTPADKGFSIVSFSGGVMAVSCKNIVEYASGSKIDLSIVNFMSAAFRNVSVDLEYMPNIFNDNGELKENFSNLIKNTSEKIDVIESGNQKIIEMILPEYKPDQVKDLIVKIQYGGIRFTGAIND